ncbi:PRP38 family-domain-containing protein, partial [Tribonema minus]
MANTTDPFAISVHGTNPQYLVEKITRTKIYNSQYWKEHCFGLTAEGIVEKAVDLKYVGGSYGGNARPSKFLCLVLKMLQLQPEKDIVIEFIKNEEFKYVRVLGAFYMRLVGRPIDIYQYLEPLYNDYRKVRVRQTMGWAMKHVDEIIDELLRGDHSFDIALPHLPKRGALEETGALKPRISVLEDAWEEEELRAKSKSRSAERSGSAARARSHSRSSSGAAGRSRERDGSRDRARDKEKERERARDKERAREKERAKERERAREKD